MPLTGWCDDAALSPGCHVAAPRDGIPSNSGDSATDTIPNNANAATPDSQGDRRYGMHESYAYYEVRHPSCPSSKSGHQELRRRTLPPALLALRAQQGPVDVRPQDSQHPPHLLALLRTRTATAAASRFPRSVTTTLGGNPRRGATLPSSPTSSLRTKRTTASSFRRNLRTSSPGTSARVRRRSRPTAGISARGQRRKGAATKRYWNLRVALPRPFRRGSAPNPTDNNPPIPRPARPGSGLRALQALPTTKPTWTRGGRTAWKPAIRGPITWETGAETSLCPMGTPHGH
eukprot:scaffold1140_cov251-Pinguiococcus_pyrenoidosus.AAC.16